MEAKTQISQNEIRKTIQIMVLPIVIESILQMTSGFCLTGMMGRLDPVSISAFSLSNRIINITWAILRGITMGSAVFVAQAYGSKNTNQIKYIIKQTIIGLSILIFIIQQFIFLNTEFVLSIFNPSNDLMIIASNCLKTSSWSLYFMSMMLICTSSLQSMNKAKISMKIAMSMNITSIIVGYLFIFGNFNMPKLGVQGAAIGTFSGYFLACFYGMYLMFNSKKGYVYFGERVEKIKFNLKEFLKGLKPDINQIKNVYKIGIPISIENSFWQLSTIILTRAILNYGEVTLAAYQLGLQAESISFMPSNAFAIAATAFVGQCVGAKNEELGKSYMKELFKSTIIITLITSIPLIFFPKQLMLILTNDSQLIDISAKYLIVMGVIQLAGNLGGVINGALRGSGFTKLPMIISAIGIWGIRVPFTIFIVYFTKLDIQWVWVAMGLDVCIRWVIGYFIYKKKDLYSSKDKFVEALE
ncbi:MATE family efflux transporter [Paraclostridium sordellii]|uniref:Probable multidrug resistance protein NorM n=1 Tax=Paraclostridium sordellii TaxID=1505 RepID=A0A9P1PAV5_PARSO|nr:MATE family efflux transporter [Paeniclostridium sordellii]CEO33737.1 putative efflux protein [[Clostridium] sordellii] [Paeniclostridium sordellii]